MRLFFVCYAKLVYFNTTPILLALNLLTIIPMILMKLAKFYIPLLLFILLKLSLEPLLLDKQLGGKGNPIRVTFTPAVDAQQIAKSGDQLIEFLHNETGYYFTFSVPSSFIAVVEAMGSGKVDIASMNTFSYIMASQKYGADAALRIKRSGGETSYRGYFFTHADNPIQTIADIHGKRIAFVDAASTSGFILPKSLLDQQGIKPSAEVFAMKHDNAVMMVYQKQVDVGTGYYFDPDPVTGKPTDSRQRLEKQYPDIYQKIRIIGFTDSIPNEPICFRKDFPAPMREKIVNAFLAFSSSSIGQKILMEITSANGLVRSTDSDYDNLRIMLKKQNVDVERLVKKK